MSLIVIKEDGLSVKGVGHQVDIPCGGILTQRVIAEQFPLETDRFVQAFIDAGFVKESEEPEAAAPATKEELLAELSQLGIEIDNATSKLSQKKIQNLIDKAKVDIAASAELIDNPEVVAPEVVEPEAAAPAEVPVETVDAGEKVEA